MSGMVLDLTGDRRVRFGNMPLEEVLDELAQHGHPKLDRTDLAGAASPHLKLIGGLVWRVHVRTAIREGGDLFPYEGRRFPEYMTFEGHGRTHREAATNCLARLQLYLETGWDHVWDGHRDAETIRAANNIPNESEL